MRILAFLAILAGLALTQNVKQGKSIEKFLIKNVRTIFTFFKVAKSRSRRNTGKKLRTSFHDQVSPDLWSARVQRT